MRTDKIRVDDRSVDEERERKKILLRSSFHAKKILSASSRFLEPNRIERSSPIVCWSLVIDVAAAVETKGGE